MRLNKLAALPEYTDGCFELYDIVDNDGERMITERGINPIWYRDIGVYDRTRITFEQADKEVTMKIRIPKWDGISSGYPETELTLVNPTMDYEVTT